MFTPRYFPDRYFGLYWPPSGSANAGATTQRAQTGAGFGTVSVESVADLRVWGPAPLFLPHIVGRGGTAQASQRAAGEGYVNDDALFGLSDDALLGLAA